MAFMRPPEPSMAVVMEVAAVKIDDMPMKSEGPMAMRADCSSGSFLAGGSSTWSSYLLTVRERRGAG